MQFLKELNVTPTLNTWFKLGTVPIPQTGRAVYQQLTSVSSFIHIQVTSGGVLNAYMTEANNWTYGTLVYPTSASV